MRAWEVRTGKLAWTTLSLDPQTGTVFIPFDSPSYDYYGGDRKGANLCGNSVVALDAMTGKLKWYFQTVHHDVWDYGAPGPPTLAEVVNAGDFVAAFSLP